MLIKKPDRFEWDFFQFCTKKKLIRDGDKIIISISGGVDSVSLLYLLHRFRSLKKIDLYGVHFNHGIRIDSGKDEELARNLCARYEIPFRSFPLQFDSSINFQNSAREQRIEKLLYLKKELGFDRIAFAHHFDDLIETVVWKMIRGTSLFRLHPMKPIEENFIRPLLQIKKNKIYEYAKNHKLPWNEDSSNRETNYTRNFIRLKILPLFREIGGERYAEKIFSLAEDSLKLNESYSQISGQDFIESGLPYSEILELPEIYAKEKIYRYLAFCRICNIRRNIIVQVYDLVKTGKGGWSLDIEKGVRVEGKKKKIAVTFLSLF